MVRATALLSAIRSLKTAPGKSNPADQLEVYPTPERDILQRLCLPAQRPLPGAITPLVWGLRSQPAVA